MPGHRDTSTRIADWGGTVKQITITTTSIRRLHMELKEAPAEAVSWISKAHSWGVRPRRPRCPVPGAPASCLDAAGSWRAPLTCGVRHTERTPCDR